MRELHRPAQHVGNSQVERVSYEPIFGMGHSTGRSGDSVLVFVEVAHCGDGREYPILTPDLASLLLDAKGRQPSEYQGVSYTIWR